MPDFTQSLFHSFAANSGEDCWRFQNILLHLRIDSGTAENCHNLFLIIFQKRPTIPFVLLALMFISKFVNEKNVLDRGSCDGSFCFNWCRKSKYFFTGSWWTGKKNMCGIYRDRSWKGYQLLRRHNQTCQKERILYRSKIGNSSFPSSARSKITLFAGQRTTNWNLFRLQIISISGKLWMKQWCNFFKSWFLPFAFVLNYSTTIADEK